MRELTKCKRTLHSSAPIGTISLNSTNVSTDIFAVTRIGRLSHLFNPWWAGERNLTQATDFAGEGYEKISRISWERHLHALGHVSDLASLRPSQILSYRFSPKSIFDLEGSTTMRITYAIGHFCSQWQVSIFLPPVFKQSASLSVPKTLP